MFTPVSVLHKAYGPSQHTANARPWFNIPFSEAMYACATTTYRPQSRANPTNTSFLSAVTYQPTSTSAPPSKPSQDYFSDLNVSEPLPLIIRATDGKGKRGKTAKMKISTIVKPEEMEAFFTRYAEVCKVGMMAGLKKRDRKARKAKKKKAGNAGGEKA